MQHTTHKRASGLALLLLIALLTTAWAAQDATQRLKFPKGKSSTSVEGKVVGSTNLGYLVGVRAGQQMSVTYQTFNRFAGFSQVAAPSGTTSKSTCTRQAGGSVRCTWQGKLAESGDYTILIENQSEEDADFTLEVTVR